MNRSRTTATAPRRRLTRIAGSLVALSLLAAACGGDDDATPATTAPPATDAPADDATDDTTDDTTDDAAPAGGPSAEALAVLDGDGDGVITFGVATPGPRDDGAYYQALVEGVVNFSATQGFESPIIVDNVDASQAETELRNLARQGVDVIAVGASEIADSLPALAAEFPDIFWYCNCGAAEQFEGVAQTGDDSSQISYSAGYATGLLLQETDATNVAFLGCCDLSFEKEAYLAFELGLKAVDPSFTMTYIPTGDFNDVASATEAFNQALAAGAGAVYPFLGGAHEAVVGLANENDVITMSAGASDVCSRTDLDYQIAVMFDAGDYLEVIFDLILAGELQEGEMFILTVGEWDFVGASFCDATPEQVAALDEVKASIAAGELAETLFEVKAEAYGF